MRFARTLHDARRRNRRLGPKAALATLTVDAFPLLSHRLQRILGRPTFFELSQDGPIRNSPREVMGLVLSVDDQDWDTIVSEFSNLWGKLIERRGRAGVYPSFFPIESGTALLAYALTRFRQPRVIVETGVADGTSSALFLAAMDLNGEGELHSLDIAEDVGTLVEKRDRWHLHIGSAQTVEDDLSDLLLRLPPVDLFFHDSDHRFLPQLMEYEAFGKRAQTGALLLSDDVDFSYAFSTFCGRRSLRPSFLFDSRKVAGLVQI